MAEQLRVQIWLTILQTAKPKRGQWDNKDRKYPAPLKNHFKKYAIWQDYWNKLVSAVTIDEYNNIKHFLSKH